MKLLLKLPIILVFISLAGFINAEDNNYGPQTIAGEFLKQMQANNFDQAAELFHFPGDYPEKKKESEFRSVRDSLKRHKDQLGNITELLKTIPKGDYIGSGVSGAEIDYWSKRTGQSPSIIIPCRFQKIDFGVIRITFCKIAATFEIKSVDYSFIKTEKSINILKELDKI